MGAGAPYGNKNAEKWNIRKCVNMYTEAIRMSNLKVNGEFKYDFIGEIARELGTTHQMLIRDLPKRFPQLQRLKNQLISNMEANCYANTKSGKIREATGIVNLKSNHHWTDRLDMNQHIDDRRKSVDDLFPKDEEIEDTKDGGI